MSTIARRNKHSPPVELPALAQAHLDTLDSLLYLDPIPGPKPWSDDVERAWCARVGMGAPITVSGLSCGIPEGTIDKWMHIGEHGLDRDSDTVPVHASACAALRQRLNKARAIAQTDAFESIRTFWGKQWQSAAWYLERVHGFVIKQQATDGPQIVINIGIVQVSDPPRIQVRSDPQRIIDVVDDVVEATSVLTGQQLTDE